MSRLASFASLFLICVPAFAQSDRGTITGEIADPAGAVVAGAPVEATNAETGAVYRAAASATGNYTLSQLPAGAYVVSVTVPGFKRYVRQNVVVSVAGTLRIDVTLEVGATSESVTVTEAAPLLKTESGELSHNMTTDRVDNLPVINLGFGANLGNVRNPLQAVTLIPGSAFANDNTVRLNGMPANTQSIRIEGQDATDGQNRRENQVNQVSLDAIQEVTVQTSNYAAEYGQAGGGYFNYTMKSGANQFHGSAYGYFVNEVLNAGTPFTDAGITDSRRAGQHIRNSQRRNNYGFTLSGPLVIPKLYNGHDKTFFFYSYEAGRRRQSGISQVLVPSALERTGDFSDWRDASGALVPVYDPSTETGGNPATRQPFANNKLAGTFSGIAQNYLKIYPQPTITIANMADCVSTQGCYNYVASLSRPYDTDNNTFRVDENLTARDRLYVTGILGEQNYHNPSAMPYTGERKYQKNRLLGVNWEHTVSANMINSLRVGYNWMKWRNGSDAPIGVNFGNQLGFGNVPGNPGLWGVPDIQLQGFQELGNTNAGWTQKENNYELVDNVKWTHGKHSFTFGTDIRRYMLYMVAGFGSTGQVS